MPARHRHWDLSELPTTDTLSEGHAQHSAEVAIAAELKWFAGHSYASHAELPGKALKVLAGHAVQGAPPLPVKPAMHVQLLILVAPPSEDEPTGQIEHAAGPGALLKALRAHGSICPSVPGVTFTRFSYTAPRWGV